MTSPGTSSSTPTRQVIGPCGRQSHPAEVLPIREPTGSLLTSRVSAISRDWVGGGSTCRASNWAGAVKAVTLNVCDGPQGRSSEGSVEIEWQAYERRTRSVVLTATTGGTAKTSRGGRDAYYDAAAAALRNLLAQEAFVKAVGSAGRAQLR